LIGKVTSKNSTWVLKLSTGDTFQGILNRKQKKEMKIRPLVFIFIVLISVITGLAPGNHTLAIEVVGANGTPIQGTHTETASVNIAPRASFSGQSGNGRSGARENGRLAQDGNLPEAASALPLLSIIGAGVLIGGLFSARKTRAK